MSGDRAVAADDLGTDLRLKLVQLSGVEHAVEHCPHVVAHPVIGGQQVVQLSGVALGLRPGGCGARGLGNGQALDVRPNPLKAIRIVLGPVVRHRTHGGVGSRPAQRLGVDGLAGRALHQVRATQSHERSALDHEDHVGQRREVRPAGDARTHDGGDLRDVQVAAHDRVVVEDARRAILSGKHAALIREVDAGRIHEVHDRNPLAHGDFLRPQDFLDRFGPPGASLHRGVVRHDHDRPTGDHPDSGDYARRRRLTVVLVVGDE